MELTEILGVRVGQVFRINDNFINRFCVSVFDGGEEQYLSLCSGTVTWEADNACYRVVIAAAPDGIIPVVEYTAEQLEGMKAYVVAGYPWAARDKDGEMAAFSGKPMRDTGWKIDKWVEDDAGDASMSVLNPALLALSLTWEDEPMNMAEELAKAQGEAPPDA